ncbi:MAG: peptidylprolyl isomerase [Acidobacteriia bacterium]|nr:peptidylprolyl isomerase [Terriglobia bacterium]
MKARKPRRLWPAILAAALIANFSATAVQVNAAGSPASPADKRKPGLYWTLQTDKGNISCKLFEAEAPVTVHTMVGLAIGKISYVHPETKQVMRTKFFDGLTFDRVIPGAIIQGGDLLGTGVGHPEGPGFPYKSEIVPSLKFDAPGRLAMANSGPDTNDTHFFITQSASPSLNGKFTIWGQCENPDVVKAIAMVPRDPGDTPLTPVHIQHAIIERVGPAPADAPEAMPADAAAH